MNLLLIGPVIYEIFIFAIAIVIEILIVKQNQKKKTALTTLLMYQFLFYTIGIAFSLVGKYLKLVNDDFPQDIPFISAHIFGLLWDNRLALSMMVIGMIYSFKFKVELFDSDRISITNQRIYIGFGMAIFLLGLIMYQEGVHLYSFIVFGFVFLYGLVVYIPIMLKSIHLAGRIEEKGHKKAIYSIALMSFSLISILLSFLMDQAMLAILGWRFSIFYYFAWAWAIVGYISSYHGYIKPAKR